ncbi:MAG: SDR family oxidoreductase [Acidimicrobiales bacterium]
MPSLSTLVITAGPGIGDSLANRLRGRGDEVFLTDPALDLTDAATVGDSLRSLIGKKKVDNVVLAALNPAAFQALPITGLSEDQWDDAAEWSMRAAFVSLQQVHEVITDGGRVIVILPTVAATGVADLVPLCTAVEAIRVMAKAVARRWGARSITVNTIEVELTAFILGDAEASDIELPVVPILGQPALPLGSAVDDVLGLFDLLTSPSGGAVTGALLVADRGTVMQP